MDKRAELADRYSSDLLFADGYDDAIIGVAVGFDSERVIYSVEKMVEVCTQDMGMSHEEAWEWLEFNTFGAYVGEQTPIYMENYKE
jgi:hypothetical protein